MWPGGMMFLVVSFGHGGISFATVNWPPAPVVPEFLPVRVLESDGRAEPQVKPADKPMDAPASCAAPPEARAAAFGTGRIEITLPDGTCVRVDDQVGVAALRQVMAVLRG